MNSDQWQQVKELFVKALDCGEETDRVTFVAGLSVSDPEIKRQLEKLLAADSALTGFMESPCILQDAHDFDRLLDTGQVLCGRFEILQLLGQGGMGQVYSARDSELDQPIAIKVISPVIAHNPQALARFKNEVYAARKVTHPNVCRTFDLERHREDGGNSGQKTITFLTMELLEGQTLAHRLRQDGPLSADDVVSLGIQIADALTAAHQAGIVHCDLKPSNIFLRSTSPGLRAVVTDFGISRLTFPAGDESQIPHEGFPVTDLLGTPSYMAPEQLSAGICTPSTDVYALGLILFEALTARKPFVDNQGQSIPEGREFSRLFDAPPETHSGLARVIEGCLQPEPSARIASAGQVAALLKAPLQATPLSAGAASANQTSPKQRLLLRLKNSPILWLLAVALIAGAVTGVYYGLKSREVTSIAVLPFFNQPGDKEIDYISAGVTDALASDLSSISTLTVTAETVVRRLASDWKDAQSAGKQLNVGAIVTGTIRRARERISLEIELINVKTGALMWSKTYDFDQGELAAMQAGIAREIAYQLQIRVEPSVTKRLDRQYQTNSAAYNAYLQGRYALMNRSASGFESALSFFQQAADNDPEYAPAFAGLADCYGLMAYNRMQPTLTLLHKSRAAAERALQLDSTLGEAYSSLAGAETLGDFDWNSAEEMYKRSIQLNPNYISAHTWYGLTFLTPLGRHNEARAQLQYALRLDPASPITSVSAALAEYYARQFDTALQMGLALRGKSTKYAVADEVIALSYLAENKPSEAISVLTENKPDTEDTREVWNTLLGVAYVRTGQRGPALQMLTAAETAERKGAMLHYQLAILCEALGKRREALHYLQKAYDNRQTSILFLKVDPLLDSMRDDPDFQSLIAKLHLV